MARSTPPSPFVRRFFNDYDAGKLKITEDYSSEEGQPDEEKPKEGAAPKPPPEPEFRIAPYKPSEFIKGFQQFTTEIEKEIDKANKEADKLRQKGFTNEQIDEQVGGRLRALAPQIGVRTRGNFQAPQLNVNIPPAQPPQPQAPQSEFEWGAAPTAQQPDMQPGMQPGIQPGMEEGPGIAEQIASSLIPFEIQQKLFGSQVPGDVNVIEQTAKGAVDTARAAKSGIVRAPYAAGQMGAEAIIGAGGFGNEKILKMAKLLREADKELLEGKYKLPPDIEKSQFLSDVASGMEMLGPMAVAVMPSLLTGNPLAAIPTTMALFGLSTYNNTKEELLAAGVNPREAERTAIIHGISEGGIESIGTFVELVTAGFGRGVSSVVKKAAKKVAKGILRTLAAEYGEEYAEEVAQGATEKYLKDKYKDNPKVQKLSWEQILKGPITPLLVSMIPLVGAGRIAQMGKKPPTPPPPGMAPVAPTAPPAGPTAPPAAPPITTAPGPVTEPVVEPTAPPVGKPPIPTLPLGEPGGTAPTPVEPTPVEPTVPAPPIEPTPTEPVPPEPTAPTAPKLPLLPPEQATGVRKAGWEVLPDDQVPADNKQMLAIIQSLGEQGVSGYGVMAPYDAQGNQGSNVFQQGHKPDFSYATFNSPYTGSSLNLHPSQLTENNIKRLLEEDYVGFRKTKSADFIRPWAKMENVHGKEFEEFGAPKLIKYEDLRPADIDYWGEETLKEDRGEVKTKPTTPTAPPVQPLTAQQAIYDYSQKRFAEAKTTSDIATATEAVEMVSKYLMALQGAPFKPSGYYASLYGKNPKDAHRLMEVRREVASKGYVDTYLDESGVQYQGLKGTPKPENLYTQEEYFKIDTAKKKLNIPKKEHIEGLLNSFGAKYTGLQSRLDGGLDVTFSKDGKNYTLNVAQWSNQAVRDALGIKDKPPAPPTLPLGGKPGAPTPTMPFVLPSGFHYTKVIPFGEKYQTFRILNRMFWVHEGLQPHEYGIEYDNVIKKAKERNNPDDRIVFLALEDFRKSAEVGEVDKVILISKDGKVLVDKNHGEVVLEEGDNLTYTSDPDIDKYYYVSSISYEYFLRNIETAKKNLEREPWQMRFADFQKVVDRFPYAGWSLYQTSEGKVDAARMLLDGIIKQAQMGYKWTRHNVHELVHQVGQHIIRESLGPNTLGAADMLNKITIKPGLYDSNGVLMPDAVETVLHEIAHNLIYTKAGNDYWHKSQYAIGQGQLYVRGEWKIVEEMINRYNPQKWENRHTYYTQQTERYARLFSLYISDNAELKLRCPTLYAKMEKEIRASYPSVIRNKDLYSRMTVHGGREIERFKKTKGIKSKTPISDELLIRREAREKAAHIYYIELALEKGLPVPPEVRKEYDNYIKDEAQYFQSKHDEAVKQISPVVNGLITINPEFKWIDTTYIDEKTTLVKLHDFRTGIDFTVSFHPGITKAATAETYAIVRNALEKHIADAQDRGEIWVGVEKDTSQYASTIALIGNDNDRLVKMQLYYEKQQKRLKDAGLLGQNPPAPKPVPPKPKPITKAKTWPAWIKLQGGIDVTFEKGEADFYSVKDGGIVGLLKKTGGNTFDRLLELAIGEGLVKEHMTLDEFKMMLRDDMFRMREGKPRMFGFEVVENSAKSYGDISAYDAINLEKEAARYGSATDFIAAQLGKQQDKLRAEIGKRIVRYGMSDLPLYAPISKQQIAELKANLTYIWKKVHKQKFLETDYPIAFVHSEEIALDKIKKIIEHLRKGMKLYRGVSERMSDPGDFGRGIYYSTSMAEAKQYGKLTEHALKLNNPLVLTVEDAYLLADRFGTISGKPGKPVGIVAGGTIADRMAAAQNMTDDIIANGYDGVVVIHNKPSRSLEIVDFSPFLAKQKEERPQDPAVNKELTNSFNNPESASSLTDKTVKDMGSFYSKGTEKNTIADLLHELEVAALSIPHRNDVEVAGDRPFIRFKLDGEVFLIDNKRDHIQWMREQLANPGRFTTPSPQNSFNITEMNNRNFLNSMYDGFRDFMRFNMPSVYAATHNLKEYFETQINKFRFFPNLPEDYVNDIRKYVIAALEKARYKVYSRDGYAGQIFGKMKEREILQVVELIYSRDEVGRQKAGKGNPDMTLEQAEAKRDELEAAAPEKIILAANQWRDIVERVRINLVNRGRLKETDFIEDYAPHTVGIYTPDWAFVVGIPTRIRRPFRQYTLRARGTSKEIVKDAETLMGHLLKIEHHNMIEDFIARETAKYDIIPRLSKDQKIALFGSRSYNKTIKSKDYPEGRKVRITIAKKPKPGTVILEEELVRVSESFRGRGNYWAYSPDHPFSLTVYTNPDGLRVMGGYKNVSLIPEAIYNSFKEFTESGSKTLYYLNLLTGYWKNMAILSHFPSFNINNMIGDSFMAAMQHPEPSNFVKELSTSINYLKEEIMDQPHTGYLNQLHKFMIEEDILGASFFHTELPGRLKGKRNIVKAIFETTMTVSQMREAINRVAYASSLFKAYQEGRGHELVSAHPWINTRKLGTREALGKIAREVLIDYGAVSKTFKWLARGLLTPFGTWYFKGSKLVGQWAWHNKGKALGAFMSIPILAAIFNNRDDESREMEMHHEDWIRGTTHFNLGMNADGTARVLILQLPQDALIGTKIFSIATDYATRVLRGEITARDAALKTIKDWVGKETRGLIFLTAPFIRFYWGAASGRDPYDKSPVYSRPIEQMNRTQKLSDLAFYFTKTMVPVLTVSMKQYQYKTPTDVLWKQTLDRFIGKESLGIYDFNPKGEIKIDDKTSITYEDLALAKWKGNQIYPYLEDVEREWMGFKGDTPEFFESKEFNNIMADLYDFRSRTDPELFPKDADKDDKSATMIGFYSVEISNMFSDPDVLKNRMRVQMERAKTDEDKKAIREDYDINMQQRIFDSYKRTYKKERNLMMKKKLDEEEYPWQDVLTMP
jgi:hypothetical protein